MATLRNGGGVVDNGNEHARTVVDVVMALLAGISFAKLLPMISAMASVLSILWFLMRMYDWVADKLDKRQARILGKGGKR